MQHRKVKIPLGFFEKNGFRSLHGFLSVTFRSLSPCVLELQFPITPLEERKKNGPRLDIAPEYSVPCFLEDIFDLQKQGFVIKISDYEISAS